MRLLPKIALALALLIASFGIRAQPAAPAEPKSETVYVASVKSQVFHKPDCQWAKKIDPKNLQTFKTREDAIKAGKRPCKACKP